MSSIDLLLNILLRRVDYSNPESLSTDEKIEALIEAEDIDSEVFLAEELVQRLHDDHVLPTGYKVSLKWVSSYSPDVVIVSPAKVKWTVSPKTYGGYVYTFRAEGKAAVENLSLDEVIEHLRLAIASHSS